MPVDRNPTITLAQLVRRPAPAVNHPEAVAFARQNLASATVDNYHKARSLLASALGGHAEAIYEQLGLKRRDNAAPTRLGNYVLGHPLTPAVAETVARDAAALGKASAAWFEAHELQLMVNRPSRPDDFRFLHGAAYYLDVAQLALDPVLEPFLAPHFGAHGIAALVGAIVTQLQGQQFHYADQHADHFKVLQRAWLLRHVGENTVEPAYTQEDIRLQRLLLQEESGRTPPPQWDIQRHVRHDEVARRLALALAQTNTTGY